MEFEYKRESVEKYFMEAEYRHEPVMSAEALQYLDIKENGVYIDGTLGGGGHSRLIAGRLTGGRLLCFDRDADAVANAERVFAGYGEKVTVIRDNFINAASRVRSLGYGGIDGALLDLGVSSHQLDTGSRGFSYMKDAPLDMRMSADDPLDAGRIVNEYPFERLREIIFKYGEERFAALAAAAIVKEREVKPIATTGELSDLLCRVLDKGSYGAGHPAKKTFQALRIEVNGELDAIRPALDSLAEFLLPGGRLVVIAFHSLEDRAVKTAFSYYEKNCVCPPSFPVCVCSKRRTVNILTKKPVYPSPAEMNSNPRSKSARLRAIEKV